jgi:hypothetical protein
VALTKGSAAAITLAAPTAAQAGTQITIIAGSAYAHVVTATGLLNDGVTGGAKNTATFAAFVGASLTLAFDVAVQHRALALPTGLALLGVALLLASCVSLVREAFAALRANSSEIDFARKLQQQRRSDGRSAVQRHEVAASHSGDGTTRAVRQPPAPGMP